MPDGVSVECVGMERPIGPLKTIETVQGWFNALQRGDPAPELCDPEIEIRNWAEFPIPGPYHGHDGLQRWWDDVAEVFEESQWTLKSVEAIDEDRCLTVQGIAGRFRHTGIEIDAAWGRDHRRPRRQDPECCRLRHPRAREAGRGSGSAALERRRPRHPWRGRCADALFRSGYRCARRSPRSPESVLPLWLSSVLESVAWPWATLAARVRRAVVVLVRVRVRHLLAVARVGRRRRGSGPNSSHRPSRAGHPAGWLESLSPSSLSSEWDAPPPVYRVVRVAAVAAIVIGLVVIVVVATTTQSGVVPVPVVACPPGLAASAFPTRP